MYCIHPTCDSKSDHCTRDISFFPLPKKPSARAIWLKLLNIEHSQVTKDSAVCSKHFLKADLCKQKLKGGWRILPGALPLVHLQNNIPDSHIVKICRICFASECQLYDMKEYNNLDRAYNILTGVVLDYETKIPQLLCAECAQRLLNSVHFRARSIKAQSILKNVVKKHRMVTLQSLRAIVCNENMFGSHLKVTHKNNFDLEIKYDANDDDDDGHSDEISDVFVKIEKEDKNSRITDKNEEELHEYMKSEEGFEDNTKVEEETTSDIKESLEIKMDIDLEDSVNDYIGGTIRKSPIEIAFNENIGFPDLEEHSDDSSLDDDDNDDDDAPKNSVVDTNDFEQHENLLVEIQKPYDKVMNKLRLDRTEDEKRAYLKDFQMLADKIIVKRQTTTNTPKVSPTNIVKLRKRESKNNCTLSPTAKEIPPWSSIKVHCKPYYCKHCNYECILKSDLDIHFKMCQKRLASSKHRKPFWCCICKQEFTFSYELTVHLRVHTGEKPYSCKVCKKTFNFKTSLTLHKRLHGGSDEGTIKKLLYDRKTKRKALDNNSVKKNCK